MGAGGGGGGGGVGGPTGGGAGADADAGAVGADEGVEGEESKGAASSWGGRDANAAREGVSASVSVAVFLLFVFFAGDCQCGGTGLSSPPP